MPARAEVVVRHPYCPGAHTPHTSWLAVEVMLVAEGQHVRLVIDDRRRIARRLASVRQPMFTSSFAETFCVAASQKPSLALVAFGSGALRVILSTMKLSVVLSQRY